MARKPLMAGNLERLQEPLLDFIDCDYPTSSHHESGTDCKLPDGSAAPYRDRVAFFNLSIFRGHVASRENV